LDAVVAAVVGVVVLGITTGMATSEHHRLDVLGYLWVGSAAVALAFRSRFPLVVFGVTAVLTITYFWSGRPFGPVPVIPTIALGTLAYRRGPAVAAIAGGALLAAVQIIDWHWDARLIGMLLWISAATAFGAAAQARRERALEQSQRIAENERLRIAREVHDVVAHSLAMINVQAGVGAHVADKRPDQAKDALLAIKEASRVALADLRATLGVVRSGDRSPVPSLARLPELVDSATAAGLTVIVRGEPGDVPAPVSAAAYRILQESLTNAVRHARGADTVTIDFVGALEILVRDNGHEAHGGVGNGLRGMRERAEALGGTLSAGPVDGGGFQVHAVLPVQGDT
jgi:signal transduction histidine kinase